MFTRPGPPRTLTRVSTHESTTTPDGATTTGQDAGTFLTRREMGWVLRRCGRHGHVVAHVDDALATSFGATTGTGTSLLRCLRCGTFLDLADPDTAPTREVGTASAPVPLSGVPLAMRGAHGRKMALLRLLAVERGGRGVLLLLASLGIAQLTHTHVAVADWLGQLATAAQPLGQQVGWDVAHSALVQEAVALFTHADQTYNTIAWLVAAYGALQVTEGIGLWGGWRWAEYLAAVATTLLVPLEVYEIVHHFTLLKVGALVVNLVAVTYLVHKGRLFGVRGGHRAYLAEVRDATLPADELRRQGRDPALLTSSELI